MTIWACGVFVCGARFCANILIYNRTRLWFCLCFCLWTCLHYCLGPFPRLFPCPRLLCRSVRALVVTPVSSTVAGGGFAGTKRPLASLARADGRSGYTSAAAGVLGCGLLPVILLIIGCDSATVAILGCGTSAAAAAAASAALPGCGVLALILLFGWDD